MQGPDVYYNWVIPGDMFRPLSGRNMSPGITQPGEYNIEQMSVTQMCKSYAHTREQ